MRLFLVVLGMFAVVVVATAVQQMTGLFGIGIAAGGGYIVARYTENRNARRP